jgi:hypothetical protein
MTYRWTNIISIESIMRSFAKHHQDIIRKIHSNAESVVDKINLFHYKNTMIEVSDFHFNKNFHFNVLMEDENCSIILSFFITNRIIKKNFISIYELVFDKDVFGFIYSTKVKEITVNNNQYFNINKIISFVCKIGILNNKDRVFCFGITYENNYFELVLYYERINLYKSKLYTLYKQFRILFISVIACCFFQCK